MAMSPKHRFMLSIEPDQLAALKAIQERTGAPVAEQIRRAIDKYLEQENASPRKTKR
jgi:predicted DNA-binding protein